MASLVASCSDFSTVYKHLLTLPPPLLPPGKPYDKSLTDRISSLYVHPCLEAALHILNHDLESAHFLVRHMQAAPMHEGMYLHGILHRIEGDFNNARAWYGDVADSDVFQSVWAKDGGLEGGRELIQQVEELNTRKGKNEDAGFVRRKEELEKKSIEEIKEVVEFCRKKFGEDKVADASVAWKQPDSGKIKEQKEAMTTGSEGHRSF